MADITLPNMNDRAYGLGLSHDDRGVLEQKASTENLLNGAAQKCGKLARDEHIDVHGDDASFREVKGGQRPWADPVHTAKSLGLEAACPAVTSPTPHSERASTVSCGRSRTAPRS